MKGSWNNCRLCNLRRAVPVAPRMAPLPAARCQSRVQPFAFTGFDYFGLLYVKGASKKLKRAVKVLDQNRILRETSELHIEWNFITPAAPHMGS